MTGGTAAAGEPSRTAGEPVTFVLPHCTEDELALLRESDPDTDWRVFGGVTRKIWIGQTFLRLRNAGYPVRLASAPPERGVAVFDASARKALFKRRGAYPKLLVVVVRADHRPQLYADVEILQNDRFADSKRRFYLAHWPQPGLIPRDVTRGTRVESISFKGHENNLHDDFSSERWQAFLRESGIAWLHDSVAWHGVISEYGQCAWNDYSKVDLCLAVRDSWTKAYTHKPASKLVNSWNAGVPAILGPEYAYMQLRRSPLDYLEVRSLEETIQAVQKLRAEPELYSAMVANGLARAREESIAELVKNWGELLFEVLPARAEARAQSRLAGMSRTWGQARHLVDRVLRPYPNRESHPWHKTRDQRKAKPGA